MRRWLVSLLSTLVGLLLAALPVTVSATGAGGTATISSFTVDTWDQLISVSGPWTNPDNCGVATFFVIQMSNANYKDLLAAVMMASASGKTIGPWFNGCVATPWGNAPLVSIIGVN